MILVTLGTQDKSFTRLLDAIQNEIDNGNIKEKVIVQAGYTSYKSKDMEIFDFIDRDKFAELIQECDLLITHGGVGSILTGLKNNKKVIAAPRLSKYFEHTNDHQLQIIEKFDNAGLILPLYDFNNFSVVLNNVKKFKPKKYKSNTNNMIKLIENYIDNNNETKPSIIKRTINYIIIFLILIAISLFSYLYIFQEEQVAVLTYHDIVNNIEDPALSINITEKKFEEQIKWLYKHNYKTITMDEFYEWKNNNKILPRKSILITFDDGWKSFYNKAMPILEKYNMKASVFIIWSYSSDNNNKVYINLDEIKDIEENHKNIEILSHSYNLHIRENAESNNYDLYNQDIKKVSSYYPKAEYYAYPFGYRNNNYIKALKDNNYKLAFTFGPYDFARKEDNNYEINRLGLFESTKDWKFKLKMFLEI